MPSRDLGVQRAKGFELSISGQPIEHLDVTAGMLAGTVRVVGPDLAAEGVAPIAFGQPRLTYVLNAGYSIPKWPALTVDLNLTRLGAAPASLDNVLYAHALNDLDLGGRYRFTVLGKPATLRAQIINVNNAKVWSSAYKPEFFQQAPRTLFAYLTTDF